MLTTGTGTADEELTYEKLIAAWDKVQSTVEAKELGHERARFDALDYAMRCGGRFSKEFNEAMRLAFFGDAVVAGALVIFNRKDVEEFFPEVHIDDRGVAYILGQRVQTSRFTPRGDVFALRVPTEEQILAGTIITTPSFTEAKGDSDEQQGTHGS